MNDEKPAPPATAGNAARSVHKLIAGDRGTLRDLAGHGARIARVAALVADTLPTPLDRHCRVANLADGVLMLHVDAPIWATRLRYLVPHLLAELRGRPGAGGVREIRFRTVPPLQEPPRPAPRTAVLPAAAAEHLRSTAATISDPRLREALLRLARGADRTT